MASHHTRALGWSLALGIGAAAACAQPLATVLEQSVEARRLTADLQVQLAKAANAANQAVMADTDEASTAYAREAGQETESVQKDIDALAPLLARLGYSAEGTLLDEFTTRFGKYRELDRTVLDLAVQNTNLKAQRQSFGPAQQASDEFRTALEAVSPRVPTDAWHVKALVAAAVSEVRHIQVLEAPHIAEADDVAMTSLEKQMASSEAVVRRALGDLAGLVQPASRPQVAAANADFDRFMAINSEIVTLSRRNSNVRSLALSLGQKRMLTAACEDSLRALQGALDKREFVATR